jgi:nitrite reductase (NADH) small subunit
VGEGRAFVVEGAEVAVFRLRDGGVRAVAARCPHRGGPLADGLIDTQQVICPLHNHAFRLADGQCTTGEAPVRTYPVSVHDGELVLHLPLDKESSVFTSLPPAHPHP